MPRADRKKTLASAKAAEDDDDEPSRIERMEADGIFPEMPPLPYPAMYRYLMEIGPTEATGMGAAKISWQSILAWQVCSGVTLSPWEASTLRKMSGAFLVESEKARKDSRPSPWGAALNLANREAISKKVGSVFAGLARRN